MRTLPSWECKIRLATSRSPRRSSCCWISLRDTYVRKLLTHACSCSRTQQRRRAAPVTRDCVVPLLNRWRWTGAVRLCIYISLWHYGPLLYPPPIYSSTSTPSPPILGHFTYLYPFLSLLAGRFGMARLRPFRVVPRRRIWDISTRSGTSHLRGRPWWWHGGAWWEMCGGALSAPLCFPARHLLLQPPPPLQGPRPLQKHTVLQLLRAFSPQRFPRADAVARRWIEDGEKCSRALRTTLSEHEAAER